MEVGIHRIERAWWEAIKAGLFAGQRQALEQVALSKEQIVISLEILSASSRPVPGAQQRRAAFWVIEGGKSRVA